MRVLPCGPDALLLEFADGGTARAFRAGLEAADLAGVAELVPAARTLLVRATGPADLARLRAELPDVTLREAAAVAARDVRLEVVYDGPDLADVADHLGVSVEALVARHTEAAWTVAFCGFAPGFGYLTSADVGWSIPRLESPRSRVPAGSVAVAGEYSSCYPTASPGGWRLVGRTDAVLWDAAAEPPALLTPGTRVRFVDVSGRGSAAPPATSGPAATADRLTDDAADERATPAAGVEASRSGLEVLTPGPRALLQDLGRPGLAALGVGPSGAADRAAHRLANRLLGNDETAATIEVLAGGLALRALEPTMLAVAGAPVPCAVDGRPVAFAEPLFVSTGATVRLGDPVAGLRSYVAVLGGFAAAPVLGSRSYDTIADLGPAPLRAGDVLATGSHAVRTAEGALAALAVGPAGKASDGWAPGAFPGMPSQTTGAGREAAAALTHVPGGPEPVRAGATWGPRADWFSDAARAALNETVWSVQADSDRVGVRLDGPALERTVVGELPSEPVVRGSVQVPPSGRPVVFLADHPTTGGYPVIAVLDPDGVDALAQLRPGDRVRLSARAAA